MSTKSQVEHLFYEKGILVSCTERPWYNNPFGSDKTSYGIEVHKKEVSFVADQLARLGISFNVLDGRYRNTNGCWTHKSFNFIELPCPEEAYQAIVEGGIL